MRVEVRSAAAWISWPGLGVPLRCNPAVTLSGGAPALGRAPLGCYIIMWGRLIQ